MITVRRATAADEPAIRALAHGERVNPTGLHWPNFFVATEAGAIVGVGQVRVHADGSRELGTLVVCASARGRGVGARLIEARLATTHGRVFTIVDAKQADRYARFGFRRIEPAAASRVVRRNYRLGRLARVLSWLRGLPPRRLVILERPAAEPAIFDRSARRERLAGAQGATTLVAMWFPTEGERFARWQMIAD